MQKTPGGTMKRDKVFIKMITKNISLMIFMITYSSNTLANVNDIPFEVFNSEIKGEEKLRIIQGQYSFKIKKKHAFDFSNFQNLILSEYVVAVTPFYQSTLIARNKNTIDIQTTIPLPCDIRKVLAGKEAFVESTTIEMISNTINNYYKKYIKDNHNFIFKRHITLINPQISMSPIPAAYFPVAIKKKHTDLKTLAIIEEKFSNFNQFSHRGFITTTIQDNDEDWLITYTFNLAMDKNFMDIGKTDNVILELVFSMMDDFTVEKIMLGQMTFDEFTGLSRTIGIYDEDLNCEDTKGASLLEGVPVFSRGYLKNLQIFLEKNL